MGALRDTETVNGYSTGYDQQGFCYDSNGRLGFKSYPYQGSGFGTQPICSGAGDSFADDALGRTTTVTHSDGTSSTATYAFRATQITDEGMGAGESAVSCKKTA